MTGPSRLSIRLMVAALPLPAFARSLLVASLTAPGLHDLRGLKHQTVTVSDSTLIDKKHNDSIIHIFCTLFSN